MSALPSSRQALVEATGDTPLANKVILVTGASRGIGREAALAYAKAGAQVLLLSRNTQALEALYDEIVAVGAPEPSIVPLDMQGATWTHYQQMGQSIIDTFGKLDGVLHNASVLGTLGPFNSLEEEEYDEVMQINLKAQIGMTQGLLPALQHADNASVVFTSSGVGRQGRAYWNTYAISKFATEGLMQTLADEYENSSLRFNAINPGKTRTTMRASAFPSENPDTVPSPEAHMPLYLYLMADASKAITGRRIDAASFL